MIDMRHCCGMAAAALFLWGCSGESAKKTAEELTRKTVEVAKGTITGIDEGIEKGRKAAESTDGARIVSTREELHDALTIEILEIRSTGAATCELVVGFGNAAAAPVRVTELTSRGSVMLLDTDDYVCEAQSLPDEFTVPPNAKQKVHFAFRCQAGRAGKLRIFGEDFEIPADLTKAAAADAAEPTPTGDEPDSGGATP